MPPAHFCHVFSGFDAGGAEVRTVTIINALGSAAKHTIMATNGRYGALDRIDRSIAVEVAPPPPGKGSLWYSVPLARTLRAIRPDLLLTYNWGAIDAVIAGVASRVCPVLHAEDGFGPEEAVTLKRRRVLTRRLVLRHARGTVVPSKVLLDIARSQYRLPPEKLVYIPNGVDHQRFQPARNTRWRRDHGIADDAVLCGSVGALRAEKNFDLLIRAFGRVNRSDMWLAIAGEGPCRAELTETAREGATSRVIFAGALADPVPFYQSLDVFALSSLTEQMPIALLEAMACGLPVVATDVGDVRDVLGSDTPAQLIVRSGALDEYASVLSALANDERWRGHLGRRNHLRCLQMYTQERMLGDYRRTYEGALGRPL